MHDFRLTGLIVVAVAVAVLILLLSILKGIMRCPDGMVYTGDFEEGLPHGKVWRNFEE